MKSGNESRVLSALHGDALTIALSGGVSIRANGIGAFGSCTYQVFESLPARCGIISKMIWLGIQQGTQRVQKVTVERAAGAARPAPPST